MFHDNLNELWRETIQRIIVEGDKLDSRAGQTKELLGFQATLTDPLKNILLGFPTRKFSLSYACAEVLWYLSMTNEIEMMEAYAPSYKNYAEDGKAYGAYGHRWKNSPGFIKEDTIFFHPNGSNQLEAVIRLLKEKPNTRQAIMTMWDSGDLLHAILGDHKDLPCTLTLKFFVRDGKLTLIADMRSNDAWLGLPYDIFCFTTLQRIIANELNLKLGRYIHQAGSEHIYEHKVGKINQILRWTNHGMPDYTEGSFLNNNPYIGDYLNNDPCPSLKYKIETALEMERMIRNKDHITTNYGDNEKLLKLDSLFRDLVYGCATKWYDVEPAKFSNPYFREWQRQNLEDSDG